MAKRLDLAQVVSQLVAQVIHTTGIQRARSGAVIFVVIVAVIVKQSTLVIVGIRGIVWMIHCRSWLKVGLGLLARQGLVWGQRLSPASLTIRLLIVSTLEGLRTPVELQHVSLLVPVEPFKRQLVKMDAFLKTKLWHKHIERSIHDLGHNSIPDHQTLGLGEVFKEGTQVQMVALFLGQLGSILAKVAMVGAFLARLLVQIKLLVYSSIKNKGAAIEERKKKRVSVRG